MGLRHVRGVYIRELLDRHLNNGWHNIAEFARFLAEVDEAGKGPEAWRTNIKRYMKQHKLDELPRPTEFVDN